MTATQYVTTPMEDLNVHVSLAMKEMASSVRVSTHSVYCDGRNQPLILCSWQILTNVR